MKIQKLVKKLENKKRGVSPVIATIIIVAIAIAISIAVALYLTGITGTFTRFERLDVTSAYSNPPMVNGTFPVDLAVKNSGTSLLSVDRVIINGKPAELSVGWAVTGVFDPTSGTTPSNAAIWIDGSGSTGNVISMGQGYGGKITVNIEGNSGQSVEITLHTVSGKEYPKVVVLP